jgi:hypothetical protein
MGARRQGVEAKPSSGAGLHWSAAVDQDGGPGHRSTGAVYHDPNDRGRPGAESLGGGETGAREKRPCAESGQRDDSGGMRRELEFE